MRLLRLLGPAALLLTAGCHSAYIDATLSNRTGQPISLVELDYPSASFGTQTLAPGQDFHYRFKVLGSGKLKLIYTDTANVEHTIPGPQLGEGDEGSLTVAVQPTGVQWGSQLKGHKQDDFPIAPN
jgi:hypothetical protein